MNLSTYRLETNDFFLIYIIHFNKTDWGDPAPCAMHYVSIGCVLSVGLSIVSIVYANSCQLYLPTNLDNSKVITRHSTCWLLLPSGYSISLLIFFLYDIRQGLVSLLVSMSLSLGFIAVYRNIFIIVYWINPIED